MLALTASAASAATIEITVNGPGSVVGPTLDGKQTFTCTNDTTKSKTCEATYRETICPISGCPEIALTPDETTRGFTFAGWKGTCRAVKEDRNACGIVLDGRDFRATASFADTEAPSVSISPLPAAARGVLALRATAADNAGVARVDFHIGGTVVRANVVASGFALDFDTATLTDGVKDVFAVAVDAAGNSTSTSSGQVKIDNTRPTLAVAGPSDVVSKPGAPLAWTLTATDTLSGPPAVSCSVTPAGAPVVLGPCSGGAGGHSVVPSAEGSFVLTVRAVDGLGNQTLVTRAFRIDGTAPVTAITSGIEDGATTTDTALSWTLGASEPGVTFECRVFPAALTPGTFAPCSGGTSHSASGFAPGTYTFETRATDAAGNVDATGVKRTFTVLPPPPAPVVAAVAGADPPAGAGAGAGAKPAAGPAPQIVVTLAFNFNSRKKSTKLTSLVIKNLPAGATVTATCAKGCSAKSFKKTGASGQVSLGSLIKKPLKVGTTIKVVVAKPGFGSAVKLLKIRARKAPLVTTRCQPVGAAKPAAC